MTAGVREQLERTSKDGGVYNLEQKLQSYLRDKYSVESLRNNEEAAVNLLSQIAKDWCIAHDDEMPDEKYIQYAREAVARYLDNWRGKTQGTDNRSHNLGRMLF